MLQRDEASLVTTEVFAVDHMMTASIDIAVPSAGDAGHSEVKTYFISLFLSPPGWPVPTCIQEGTIFGCDKL